MLGKLLNNRYILPILLTLLIVPSFTFLLKPGLYWNMHDDMQMIRQLELEKCLKDGQLPCRWTPDLGFNYGYPLFNFYPPFPYIVGQSFRLLGFSYVATVKATSIVLLILSALAMYLLAKSLTGRVGGFLAALFYSYAPYHAVNIYVRGAMNEAWASLFLPLIFYFSRKYLKKHSFDSLILLSLSWAGLLLSHNPIALTFILFFAPWCFYWYFIDEHRLRLKPIIYMGISGIFALALSAFFTLPVLFESKLVQIESMFQNYYHYSVHFVSLKQLFLNDFWGDGPSVWGVFDGMSYSLGTLYWVFPSLIAVYFIYQSIKIRSKTKFLLPIMIISLAYLATFLSHERSAFIWLILSPIQKIQFPWRFLSHSVFLFSLSLAFLPIIIKKISPKIGYIIIPIISIAVLLLNYKYFFPVTFGPITDNQKFSGLAWNNQITSGIYDYLPKTASTAAKIKASEYIDSVNPTNTEYKILPSQKGTDWWLLNLQNENPATFTLAALYFPNFLIFDNQQPLDFVIEPELGRITVKLEPGLHQIYLKLYDTPIRSIGNYLSLFAWIFVLVYFFQKLWKTMRSKK